MKKPRENFQPLPAAPALIIIINELHRQEHELKINIILYVADQQSSTGFYQAVLARQPDLNVPGMTEFRLSETCVLGLMPEAGIRRLLGESLPDPAQAKGVPRAEVYLTVDDPAAWHARALANGARELSPLTLRNWGDEVAYSLDPDGHVLCFATAAGSQA